MDDEEDEDDDELDIVLGDSEASVSTFSSAAAPGIPNAARTNTHMLTNANCRVRI